MDFKCNYCTEKFTSISETIKHLKIEHNIAQNNEQIGCIVNFREANYCKKSYLTFSGLRAHAKTCVIIKCKQDQTEVLKAIA